MRVVVAVDWSDPAFNAVQALPQLYTPKELALVHAVDLRPFEYPLLSPPIAKQAYGEFREAMLDAGRQLLDQTAALVPPGVASVRRLCEIGPPAAVVLDAARSAAADLVVVGARGRGRVAELVLGSVSHRVLLHATCPTLVVKSSLDKPRRVLIAVEGPEDGARIQGWLLAHPFNRPVDVLVMSVVPTQHFGEPASVLAYERWRGAAVASAQEVVNGVAAGLSGAHFTAAGQVMSGDPAAVVAREADRYDLLVVGSHGRRGVDRFLLGSVSHSIVHRTARTVLVVR